MKQELLAQSPLLVYPIVALFMFIMIFLYVTWNTYRKRAASYDGVASLPLSDGNAAEGLEEESRHE